MLTLARGNPSQLKRVFETSFIENKVDGLTNKLPITAIAFQAILLLRGLFLLFQIRREYIGISSGMPGSEYITLFAVTTALFSTLCSFLCGAFKIIKGVSVSGKVLLLSSAGGVAGLASGVLFALKSWFKIWPEKSEADSLHLRIYHFMVTMSNIMSSASSVLAIAALFISVPMLELFSALALGCGIAIWIIAEVVVLLL